MPYLYRFSGFLILLLRLAPAAGAQTVADSGTFVVRHGGDTVATETFSRQETSIQGTLTINNSRHTFQRYTAVIAPDATVPMIDVAVREDADSGRIKARLVQRARGYVATVKSHVSRVLEKLEFNNRVQIALLAHDAGEA